VLSAFPWICRQTVGKIALMQNYRDRISFVMENTNHLIGSKAIF